MAFNPGLAEEDLNCSPGKAEYFFPRKGDFTQMSTKFAKALCNGDHRIAICPVRNYCREYAINTNQRIGVWGGMSPQDRQREKKRRDKEGLVTEVPSERLPAKKTAARAVTLRKPTGQAARWAETRKMPGWVLPATKEYMETAVAMPHRSFDRLHVSEVVKSDFCPRAAWMRITAVRAGWEWQEPRPAFVLANIFDEGRSIHAKWQNRWWDMGALWGTFGCNWCEHVWDALAPTSCPQCSAKRSVLRYQEVNLRDDDHLLVGHADGEFRNAVGTVEVEIKSIGLGTLRYEAPSLLARYTRTFTDENGNQVNRPDLDALWNGIRGPFPSHLRQGSMYLYLRNLRAGQCGWPPVERISFLYEFKPTQAPKEFIVAMDEQIVRDVLDDCHDVVWCLQRRIQPGCRNGRELCPSCIGMRENGVQEYVERTRGSDGEGVETRQEPRDRDAHPAGARGRITRGPHRPRRPGADEPAGSVHRMGRLLRSATRDGGS